MNFFKSYFNKIFNKTSNYVTVRLSVCLAILTSFVILITMLLFTAFVLFSIKNLINSYDYDLSNLKNSLVRMVVRSVKISDMHSTEQFLKLLHNESIISYGYIKDLETDKIKISIGLNQRRNDDEINASNVQKLETKIDDKYEVYMVLPEKDNLEAYRSGFLELLLNIMGLFIAIGVITSYFAANFVSTPLVKLSEAAKEVASGNFNVKIKNSIFAELNSLGNSYNEMTLQLSELYSSLEAKVQERTQALESANYQLKEAQAMMVHSEKMRSLGELVAGIAHEINNPINFIHGNIVILQNYANDLLRLVALYDENSSNIPDDAKAKIDSLKKEIDLDFLKDDISDLIRSCIEGTDRTKNIVLDLKNFSRMEEMVLTQFDIPKEIDTTLNILNNKYKNRINVIKNYAPDAPKIEAYGGQLNQVFMNILDNAQDAMGEFGTLTINVMKNDVSSVKIEFIDTGKGIPEENLAKVFDPFFTTKPVGKGTGLGMSISYKVITNHNGTINVESEVGKGTKFTIILPVNHEGPKS